MPHTPITADNPCGCASSASGVTPIPLLATEDTKVCVRPLTPSDSAMLDDWFAALSPESRRLRFFGPKNQLTGADRLRFLDLDGSCRHSLIATTRDAVGIEHAVALGGFVCDQSRAGEAEIAIAVIDELQGRGVGTALLRTLGCSAATRGIPILIAEVLWDNASMRGLLKRLAPGARGSAAGGGSIRYRIRSRELAGALDCSQAAA